MLHLCYCFSKQKNHTNFGCEAWRVLESYSPWKRSQQHSTCGGYTVSIHLNKHTFRVALTKLFTTFTYMNMCFVNPKGKVLTRTGFNVMTVRSGGNSQMALTPINSLTNGSVEWTLSQSTGLFQAAKDSFSKKSLENQLNLSSNIHNLFSSYVHR